MYSLSTCSYTDPQPGFYTLQVYAPARFLKYKPEVYVARDKEFNVSTKFEYISFSVDKFGQYTPRYYFIHTLLIVVQAYVVV